jgi:hypothetical protein
VAQEAVGSSPFTHPIIIIGRISKADLIIKAPVAQLDRASDSGSEGRGFDSCQVHQLNALGGPLAQLAEQLTLNQ